MPEGPLSQTRNDLRFRVGWYLGYGTDYDACGGDQQDVIDYCISSGLRKFYFPEPVDGRAHQWTFMRPWRTVATVVDQGYIALEQDVCGIDGNLFFDPSESAGVNNDGVEQVPYHKIQRLRQKNQGVIERGYPRMVSITVHYQDDASQTSTTESQRLRLQLWPTPDDVYTLHYQALIRPDYAAGLDSVGTDDNKYLLGSAEHSETILAACLSVAEQFTERRDRQEEDNFQRRLRSSIEWDRQAIAPEKQGYMTDPSDRELERSRLFRRSGPVTYNNILYPEA